MKTNPTKPDRGQDASIAARERKGRLEPRFVLFSLRSWCSFAAFLLLLLSAGSGFAAVRYVDANSTGATPPYTSWATAAATIQQAVDAAAPGDEIVVTNGIYATGGRAVGTNVLVNRVAVDKPLALRSVNGPELTIIRGYQVPGTTNGDGAIRCVYLAEGASLSGFTLTNGATRTDGELQSPNRTGGGVWSASTNALVRNCVIIGNSAGREGGGAYVGTLYNCTLSGNVAEVQGGGATDSTLYNCTLTGNSAHSGGGASYATLYNCTLTGNSAGDSGGGVRHGLWGKECRLYNCIAYFNRAPNGANYSQWNTFEYSCTTPLPPGPGNIAADPQLAGPAHLSPNSPCIGAGSPAYASGVDIDADPWASPPAMGADQPGPATGPLSLGIEAGFTTVATGHAATFTAANTGSIRQSVWDFADGTLLTNQPFASHAWSAPGVYTVRLTGYNDSYPGGVTASVAVTVIEAVHYVNQAGSNPVFPYASWETAARTIQEAIGATTVPGRLVLVTNGVYRVGTVETNGLNRVALMNEVVVRSVNGPEVTVIEGETNGVRCAYVGNGSVLSGFTLRKGVAVGDGGGAMCQSAFGVVTNCTLTANSAGGGGGASGGTLNNCIVYFNRAPNGANYSEWTTFEHSCATPLPPGPGNIAADPRLAGPTHLSPTSPCIGVGSSAYASGVDIDGEPWVSPPAMGADQPGSATGPLSLGIEAGFTTVATGYAASFTAATTGPIRQSVWDFGDGMVLTNQPFPGHAWSAPGVYTVRLTGYNDSYPGGVTASVAVTVIEAVHYVNQAGSNPVFPYASWETAARTIQEAIGATTVPGRLVLVTNGVYRVGTVETNGLNRVALTNEVVVRSVNGPEVTVIEGETNGVRCAYVGNGSVLSGFTLRKGVAVGDWSSGNGGGAMCQSAFGVVTNCVLTGNSAMIDGGGAYEGTLNNCTLSANRANGTNPWQGGGGASHGTLNNCTLTANRANGTNSRQTGGGASYGTLNNCTLTGNSAQWGGGASDSTLYNCTLTSNSASASGGGAFDGTLFNCLLSSNSAEWGGGAAGGTLNNCTLTGNSATTYGGGCAYVSTLNNCIVYYNTAANAPNYAGEQGNYSCTTPMPTDGFGNITNAPLFVDFAAGDFRLRPDSPCIDAGTNLTELISTDLLGLPRALDGNGDGIALADMGAYEFNPYRFEPALELTADGLEFTVRGEPGKAVRIERSRDLVDWEPVATVPIPASGQTLIDPAATTEPFLFYRAVSAP